MKRFSGSNYYNAFSCGISLDDISGETTPKFIHEYCHHLHNITCVTGAERYNLFMQFFSHLSGLGAKSKVIKLPLDVWVKDGDSDPSVATELIEIREHFEEWSYLERCLDILTSFEADLEFKDHQTLKIDCGPEDISYVEYPAVCLRKGAKAVCYPIGGFFLQESAAFCMEQLWTLPEARTDLVNLSTETDYLPYHFTSFLFRNLFKDPELVFLAGFMIADLSIQISTPAVGLKRILRSHIGGIRPEWGRKELVHWYNSVLDIDKDLIEMNYTLETEMLDNIIQTYENSRNQLLKDLAIHAKLVKKGMKIRMENPGVMMQLLPGDPATLKKILRNFPPNYIQTKGGSELLPGLEKNMSKNNYWVLDSMTKFFMDIYHLNIGAEDHQYQILRNGDFVSIGGGEYLIKPDPVHNSNAVILENILYVLNMKDKPVRNC